MCHVSSAMCHVSIRDVRTLTHHLEGLGDAGSEHADSEEDEERGSEADSGDDAETVGLAPLQSPVISQAPDSAITNHQSSSRLRSHSYSSLKRWV